MLISWQVPSKLVKDSLYKIKVTSINDNNIFDLSDNNFFINTGVTGVNEANNTIKNIQAIIKIIPIRLILLPQFNIICPKPAK